MMMIFHASQKDFKEIWADYFELYRDYGEIKNLRVKSEFNYFKNIYHTSFRSSSNKAFFISRPPA